MFPMRWLFTIFCLAVASLTFGQDARLAQQYYLDGEFEKAATLYERLYLSNDANDYYFERYVDCLLSLERFEDADRVIAGQIRRFPDNVQLYVTRGKLLERQYKDEEAMQQYQLAIEQLPKNQYAIIKLANAFTIENKYDLAAATYEKGADLLKDKSIFAFNLGELYRRKGDSERMITQCLNSLDRNPERLNTLQTIFQRFLLQEDLRELRRQLYARLQEDNNNLMYAELLTWVFIQQKDYKSALRQVRALDRRLKENGQRVYQLAEIAANDKDYDTAIEGYDYIVEEKGITSSFYLDAKREALRNRRLKMVAGYEYSQEELQELDRQYESFLNEFGRSRATASIIIEQAELEALYLNQMDQAIRLLENLLEFPQVNPWLVAQAKLNLADYYLIKGARWEATLLYSQVDKAFKDDPLGHEARFRNARLSYYMGDFEWAQSQFEVLKASTSKLIANDALDLSVFIMDNLGLDSTVAAMSLFAQAELLVFQNRFTDAFVKLDSINLQFPEHALEDDVWYLKAQVYQKKREYPEAATMLERIVEKHPDGIRADNALFELAQLYQNQLQMPEKAMALYEKLFIEYASSTLAGFARKAFRKMRGDDVQ